MPRDITHLEQNQLMQQDPLAHVRERDATQYDERADHVALSPCFQDQAVAICWLGDCFIGRDRAIEQLWQRGDGAHACGVDGGVVVGLRIVRYSVLSPGVSASLMRGELWDAMGRRCDFGCCACACVWERRPQGRRCAGGKRIGWMG
jgi:hypothetical protein